MSRSTGRTGPRDPRRTTTRQPPLEGKDLAERPEFKAVWALVEKDGPIIEQMAWLADWQREGASLYGRMQEAAEGSSNKEALRQRCEVLVSRRDAFEKWVQEEDAEPPHPGGGKTQARAVKRRLAIDYLRFGGYRGPSGSSSLPRPERPWSQGMADKLAKHLDWAGADKHVRLKAWRTERELYSQPWPPPSDSLQAELATRSRTGADRPSLPPEIPLEPGHLAALVRLLAQVLARVTAEEERTEEVLIGRNPFAEAPEAPRLVRATRTFRVPSPELAELLKDPELLTVLSHELHNLVDRLTVIAPLLRKAGMEHFFLTRFRKPADDSPPKEG